MYYDALAVVALAVFLASIGYLTTALLCLIRFQRRLKQSVAGRITAPVTLLKPLCGLERELDENLRSFCRQDYGTYQIVFAVRDKNDPTIGVVRALMAEFPDRDIALVVDDRLIGANHKVSNLANMMTVAKHDLLIVSDSDMRVAPTYISAMVAPFESPAVGATTSLYSGSGGRGLASQIGAMYINDWFFPSSLIAVSLGELKYCFGATIAVRREVMTTIGGFAALADYIADDYMLGRLVSEAGHKIALAPYVIENVVHENSWKTLFLHEIRWARTIRSVQPVGYTLSAVTELFAISLLAGPAFFAATGSLALLAAPLLLALGFRYALHHAVWVSQPFGGTYNPWLIPLRDLFTLAVRIASYFGSRVHWREQVLTIRRDSLAREPVRSAAGS